jgi:cysteine desulfurase / selenocysteine lyase
MVPESTYLNTASFGLIDPEVKAVADAFYTDLAAYGSSVSEAWRTDSEPRIRETIGGFLGAEAKNIAMIPNFSWGFNGVVQSLKGTERVLLYRGDFPSVLEPFILNGFEIVWIDDIDGFALRLEQIEDAIRNRLVDIVALSHVQYNSGYKLPLAQIANLCREHDVCFIVDATQSMGAVPIDVVGLDLDVFIASNYKWMNAGFGTGIMYLKESFLKKYPPVVGGFASYTILDGKFRHILSAKSYEPGHPNVYGLNLLKASIVNIQSRGVAEIEAHNMRLIELLLEGISPLSLPLIGPTTLDNRASFVLLNDEDGLSDTIIKGGFVVTNRGGRVRISLHHYNTREEVLALIDCLKAG